MCVCHVMWWLRSIDTEKKREKMAPKTSASNPKVVRRDPRVGVPINNNIEYPTNRERGKPWEVARPPSAIISTGVRCSY